MLGETDASSPRQQTAGSPRDASADAQRGGRPPLLVTAVLALLGALGVTALLGMPRARPAEAAAAARVPAAAAERTPPADRGERRPATAPAVHPRAAPAAPAAVRATGDEAASPSRPGALDPSTVAPAHAALAEPSLDRAPATGAAGRIVARLAAIQASARVTRYVHFAQVDEAAGSYLWDCSGMVGWVLRHESPRHFAALGSRRPFARDFARLVRRSSTLYPRHGWRRVLHVRDARAGDVFAWEHAQGDLVTGHVGFVLAAPTPVAERASAFAVRVADSTKQPHDDDTRAAAGDTDGGLGEGTMYFTVDDTGRGVAYAWDAAHLEAPVRTRIWIGRLE